jgi:tRNA-splicing ligase RtcB
MAASWKDFVHKIDDNRWEIRESFRTGMRVPGLIYASENMLGQIWEDKAFEQVINVAFLPGIVGHSLAIPDNSLGLWFSYRRRCRNPGKRWSGLTGGVGFDINCGVRLLRTNLSVEEIRPLVEQLVF